MQINERLVSVALMITAPGPSLEWGGGGGLKGGKLLC